MDQDELTAKITEHVQAIVDAIVSYAKEQATTKDAPEQDHREINCTSASTQTAGRPDDELDNYGRPFGFSRSVRA